MSLLLAGAVFPTSCTNQIPLVNTLPSHGISYPEKESYIIGPSDVLDISVWKEPELSKQVVVRMDGKITLPLIDDIQAENLTLSDLQTKIEQKYKDFVEAPEVTVILFASNSRKYYIHGKVEKPGEYLLQKQMTFLQALTLAGGLQKWADRDNIQLIRKIEGIEQIFRIDYDAIISGKDLKQNILIMPDDTLYVP